MTMPPPLALAHALAPALAGLHWGIGGSCLLHHLGLEAAPRDLDIVTTPEHFEVLRQRVEGRLGPGQRPPHPDYRTRHFLQFVSPQGVGLDLLAGIAVRRGDGLASWHFDPASVQTDDGLPWMRVADWLQLYRLFGRSARVARLEAWLARPPG